MPKTYTVNEVANILGYSTNSIYTFLKEKRIKGVRVGKGRFRIPEEELSRILHLSKKSVVTTGPAISPENAIVPQSIEVSGDTERLVRHEDAVFFSMPLWKGKVAFPSFIDWFVGMAAVVAGVALYLFNGIYANSTVALYNPVINAMKMIFIASGLGLILSSVNNETKGWRNVFRGTLMILGGFNAFMLFRLGDIDGGIVYGAIALVLLVLTIIDLQGILAFGVYISILAIAAPLVFVFAPESAHIAALASVFHATPLVLGGVMGILSLGFLILFWTGYKNNTKSIIAASVIIVIAGTCATLGYAQIQYWSRAFYMMVVVFFASLFGFWTRFQDVTPRRHLLVLHGLFAAMMTVFLTAVLVVFVLQQNIWESSKVDFFNKITTGQNTIATAINSIQSSLVVASANPQLVVAIEKKDVNTMAQIAKVVYESNKNIRRLVFFGKEGDGLAIYPYGLFDQANYSYRDYFTHVRETKRPYVSDVFLTHIDNVSRYVVGVAVPVLDKKGEIVGIVVGSVDLDRIGYLLSQVAVTSRGEYFVVVDHNNTIIFHPNTKLVGTPNPKSDALVQALNGKKGVMSGQLISGVPGMVAYAPVDSLRWGVSLRVPIQRVYSLGLSTSLTIIAIILLISLGVMWFVNLLRITGWRQNREGGT